jgi:hypothetical protein
VRQDSVVDSWGEDNRECTSFVAWALSTRNHYTLPWRGGDAYKWGSLAQARGITVNDTPTVGSVAWEPQLPGHYWGHVMWVSNVVGNQVTVEEYNEHGNGTYDQRTFTQSSKPYHYIHFKDLQAGTSAPVSVPPPTSPPSGVVSTHAETTGSVAATWSNYNNAGGSQGPSIAKNSTVQISCKLTGFKVADGNTWWYRLASSPWNNNFYVSADAFYNNGSTSGTLKGTPWVDSAVPNC